VTLRLRSQGGKAALAGTLLNDGTNTNRRPQPVAGLCCLFPSFLALSVELSSYILQTMLHNI